MLGQDPELERPGEALESAGPLPCGDAIVLSAAGGEAKGSTMPCVKWSAYLTLRGRPRRALR